MKNLKEISEKYSDKFNSIGHIGWGGKQFYEINSEEPLHLNRTSNGFILNEFDEVELFDIHKKVPKKRHYYTDEEWNEEVDYETEYFWDEEQSLKWWGKSLDNYYPWPWYPEKEIRGFVIIRDIPLFETGEFYECEENGVIRSNDDFEISYFTHQCLEYPEFFKPIYR